MASRLTRAKVLPEPILPRTVMPHGAIMLMTTSSDGNIFHVTGLLCGSSVNSPHKDQWRGASKFSLICAWTSSWAHNGDTGDLRRYRAHYDVSVMLLCDLCTSCLPYSHHGDRYHNATQAEMIVDEKMIEIQMFSSRRYSWSYRLWCYHYLCQQRWDHA